jgi:amino acid transporter
MRSDAPETFALSTTASRVAAPPPARTAGLSTFHLVVLLVMSHAPMLLLWLAIPTIYQYSQVVAAPLIFVLGGLLLATFAVSYGAMAKHVRHRGGLYAIVAHGLGRMPALGAAATMLACYVSVVATIQVLFAGTLSGLTVGLFDVRVPVWFGVLIGVAATTALAALPIRTVVHILIGLAAVQVVAILWFDGVALGNPAGGSVSYAGLDPAALLTGSFGLALTTVVATFAGGESGPNYAADLRDPAKSVRRATLIAYGITTVVLAVSCFALSVATGPENTATKTQAHLAAQASGEQPPFVLAVLTGLIDPGRVTTVANLIGVAVLLSALGWTVTQHTSIARVVTGLADDGAFPRAFAGSRRGDVPVSTKLAVPVVTGLLALVITSFDDPAVLILLSSGPGLGITALMALCSLATIVWFLRRDSSETGFFGWEGQITAAVVSMVVMVILVAFGVMRLPSVLPGGEVRIRVLLVGALVVVFVGGLVWAMVLRATRPAAYARIGAVRPDTASQ